MVYVKEDLGCIGMYTHLRNTIPCISTLVVIDTEKKDLAHDIAVQVAVSNSKYRTYADISSSVLEKETEVTRTFLCSKYKDKQEDVFDSIVKNSVKKALSTEVLDEQYFVKEPTVKVKDILRNEKTSVLAFYILSVGM
jgi:elongation factor Ts